MTGQTSGHNGVWYNAGRIGGYQAFEPHSGQTVFRWLHDAGYRTGFIGKFLNGYTLDSGDYHWMLPGVDEWDVLLLDGTDQAQTGCDPNGYFATCYSHNGALEKHSESEYSTTTSGMKAASFIRGAPKDQPLFLYYAPRAPHLPTTPEPRYAKACEAVPQRRLLSFNANIVHGPAYMRRPPYGAEALTRFDAEWLADCRTLLSVDDQVSAIVQALGETGRLTNTLIMFTSDNGFLLGEHRWSGKIVPYQESTLAPLVLRWDAKDFRRGALDFHLLTNVDYAATILDAAGVDPPDGYVLDGQSILPLLGGAGTWRTEDAVLLEHAGGADVVPPYCGVQTLDWMFTRYATGEEELYDAHADRYQLTNVVGENPTVADSLRAETRALCRPLPPGFSWGVDGS
jgi:arylsulfatase A-like enzyme